MAVSGRFCLLLALVCLLALSSAGPALAGEIIVNESCSLHDAIIAANTDSPAGGCPAGSGADVLHHRMTGVWHLLTAPLPAITSNITITSASRQYRGLISGVHTHAFFDVASGGVLTLERVRLVHHRPGAGAYLVVRRGGQAIVKGLPGSGPEVGNRSVLMDSNSGAPCDNAIYNEGSLTVSDAQFGNTTVYEGWGEKRPLDPINLDARVIINNGGTVSVHAVYLFFHEYDVACGAPGLPAGFSRPAPMCELEPQLQVGDRAIRSGGGQFSNLRGDAGISGERIGRIEAGSVVDVIEGPVEADGYNWYRVTADEELEGWVAEAPARSFNCAYYFVSFTGELPPDPPEVTPERQECDIAVPLVVGDYAIIAQGSGINYRADPGLDGARSGVLQPGIVLEVLDGPEAADGYQWWNVGNPVLGIDGWVAEGSVAGSDRCLRWLLPLEVEETMEEDADLSETEENTESSASEEAVDVDSESPASEEATDEDSETSSS